MPRRLYGTVVGVLVALALGLVLAFGNAVGSKPASAGIWPDPLGVMSEPEPFASMSPVPDLSATTALSP
jgi:hypothetical protein